MKLKPKMKSKIADQLGERYEEVSDELKHLNGKRTEVVELIKRASEEEGESIGDRTVLRGRLFEVGFTTTKPQSEVDWAAFLKAHPRIATKITTISVDESKVERLLESGELPRKLLAKYVRIIPNTQQKRVYVSRRGRENHEA